MYIHCIHVLVHPHSLNTHTHTHTQLSTISVRLLQTLEIFRKEGIKKAMDEKKRYDKASEKYYDAVQKHLGTNPKKKDLLDVSMELAH